MECKLGYFGKFCNVSCPPGRFGDRCGGKCLPECAEEYCNPVSGCHNITKNTTPQAVSVNTVIWPEKYNIGLDGVNGPRTPKIIDWTVEENSRRLASSSTISPFTEKNTKNQIFSKETPFQKNEINTNYLLAGTGAIIFMLLIIIVIQTSRKSKSARKKNQICDETLQRSPNDHSKKYLNVTSSKQSNHFYRHMDPVYHEIDESLELMQIPASTDSSTEFVDDNLPECIKKTTSDVKDNDDGTSKSYVLPSTCPDKDNADYLQPVFIHADIEIESKQETNSYFEVTA